MVFERCIAAASTVMVLNRVSQQQVLNSPVVLEVVGPPESINFVICVLFQVSEGKSILVL